MSTMVAVVLLVCVLAAVGADLLYRRLVFARYVSRLNAQLLVRQEKHRQAWQAVREGLERLVRYAGWNKVASQYARARTELLAAGGHGPDTARRPVLRAESTNTISTALGIDEDIAVRLLRTYQSIDALLDATDEDVAAAGGVDIKTAREIIRRVRLWKRE